MHLHLWIKIPFFLYIWNSTNQKIIFIRKPLFSPQICVSQQWSFSLRFVRVRCWMCFYVWVSACVKSVSCQRWKLSAGLWFPILSWRLSQFVRVRKGKNKTNQTNIKKTAREEESCPPPTTTKPPPRASVLSLIIVVFFLFAIRQRSAGSDLPVAIQPLLHHLGDEWVVAVAGAFLKSHQNAALCHTAVHPLPQQLLLLLFITHLMDKRNKCDYQKAPHYYSKFRI